jgi:serine/threonine-protein kinase RsbW
MHERDVRNAAATPLAWSRAFPARPCQVREARRFLRQILDGLPAADDAVLCLSELAANAVIHSNSRKSGGRFTVRAEIRPGDRVRVEVEDQGGSWTQPACADGQHGRGLLIVGRLTSDGGISGDSETGWTVWFEIAGR